MARCGTFFVVALMLVALVGCEKSEPGKAGKVAMVDLEQVAQEIGRAETIQRTIQASQKEAQDHLQAVQAQMKKQIDQEAATARLAPPSANANEKLAAMQREFSEQFNHEVTEAQQKIERIRADQIGQLRDDVRGVAKRVAAERGMSIVEVKHPGILDVSPESDITADVIREMKKMGTAGPPEPTMQRPMMGTGATTKPAGTQPGGF